jgi:hypothetical protein
LYRKIAHSTKVENQYLRSTAGTAAPWLSRSMISADSDGESLPGLDGQDRATLPAFPLHSTAALTSPQHLHRRGEFFACIQDKLSSRVRANKNFMASVAIASRQNQLLEWFPFYVHRFVSDVRYRAMKDYQQAWYLNLLFASWVSERPGYLPDDGQLWRLANAQRRYFFEKECGPVMCMFEREGSTADGVVWIYNRALLNIYDEQVLKFHRKKRKSTRSTKDENTSYLDFEGTLKKENERERCAVHPYSGLTQWGTCWGCYSDKYSSDCETG